MDATILYGKIQSLVPTYKFSDEDLKLIYNGIQNNIVDLDLVESRSNTTISAIGDRVTASLDDIRIYILKLMLGGIDLLPSEMVSDGTNTNEFVDADQLNYRFSIDRSLNGSIKLNTDRMKNKNSNLFVDNKVIIYYQSDVDNIIDINFKELKRNATPYKEDLRSKIDSLLEQIADLKSKIELKNSELEDKNNTISILNDTVKALEENYKEIIEELNNSNINNPNIDSIQQLQNSISDIYIQLAQNNKLDSDQELTLKMLPNTIRSILQQLLNDNKDNESDGTDDVDTDPDTDVDFGEGNI